MIKREPLDNYDILPEAMETYLRYYGRHFNKKLCDFAVSKMRVKSNSSRFTEAIKPMNKEEVDTLLKSYNIILENNVLYDYIYVANMCKADYLHSSIEDNKHLCLFIKDTIDDVDAPDGVTFNRWYATMCRSGEPIEWEEML